MIDRPKYLEYRHQRDRIATFTVQRLVEVKLQRPANPLLRMVGKKITGKADSFSEEWTVEVRTTDVLPDRSAQVKTQVTEATRSAHGSPLAYGERENPTTEFLNEVVDLYGMLSSHSGSLPTPHLVPFPEEPVKQGQEWVRTRSELVPISAPDGHVKGYEARPVTYSCRLERFDETKGIEYAVISMNGLAEFVSSAGLEQAYSATGRVRFALREGHMLSADVVRSMAVKVGTAVLTRSATEKFAFTSRGTEQTTGGMRI